MLHKFRRQSSIKKGGIVASAALVAGTGVFYASAAFADPTPQLACGSEGGDNRHFVAYAAVEQGGTVLTGYWYKIYGAIGDQNNIDLELRNEYGSYVPGTWTDRDEIPETSSTTWTWMDLSPNRPLNPANVVRTRGYAKFDTSGIDPECTGYSRFW